MASIQLLEESLTIIQYLIFTRGVKLGQMTVGSVDGGCSKQPFQQQELRPFSGLCSQDMVCCAAQTDCDWHLDSVTH